MTGPTIGVLALQGAYAAHQHMLHRLGAVSREVRLPQDLEGLDGLILPGGESTTQLHFLQQGDFWPALQRFLATHPSLGTCAGLILLARNVLPEQPSLGVLDVAVQRNAYGRQKDSSIRQASTTLPGGAMELVLIRAPRIVRCGPAVEVLAQCDGEPVLVRQGRAIGCSFHSELGEDTRVHGLLIEACRNT